MRSPGSPPSRACTPAVVTCITEKSFIRSYSQETTSNEVDQSNIDIAVKQQNILELEDKCKQKKQQLEQQRYVSIT